MSEVVSTRLHKVIGQLLMGGPLGEDGARVVGFGLHLPLTVPTVDRPGLYALEDPFDAVVDEELYARVGAVPEGVIIPIELPCVFLAEITSKADAQQLREGEAICQAWERGPTFGRRECLGHAFYPNHAVAQNHHMLMTMHPGDDPSGDKFIFGSVWRVRVDAGVVEAMRASDIKFVWAPALHGSQDPNMPLDHWTARRDPR